MSDTKSFWDFFRQNEEGVVADNSGFRALGRESVQPLPEAWEQAMRNSYVPSWAQEMAANLTSSRSERNASAESSWDSPSLRDRLAAMFEGGGDSPENPMSASNTSKQLGAKLLNLIASKALYNATGLQQESQPSPMSREEAIRKWGGDYNLLRKSDPVSMEDIGPVVDVGDIPGIREYRDAELKRQSETAARVKALESGGKLEYKVKGDEVFQNTRGGFGRSKKARAVPAETLQSLGLSKEASEAVSQLANDLPPEGRAEMLLKLLQSLKDKPSSPYEYLAQAKDPSLQGAGLMGLAEAMQPGFMAELRAKQKASK